MRLSLILIMVLVVVFGMISCDRQRAVDEKKLSIAEELMPDNPDSAYKLLNDILFPENMDAGKRAGYARLYAESASASDKSFSSDTLLKSAADYYISVGDSVSAASSMKYEGRQNEKNWKRISLPLWKSCIRAVSGQKRLPPAHWTK